MIFTVYHFISTRQLQYSFSNRKKKKELAKNVLKIKSKCLHNAIMETVGPNFWGQKEEGVAKEISFDFFNLNRNLFAQENFRFKLEWKIRHMIFALFS